MNCFEHFLLVRRKNREFTCIMFDNLRVHYPKRGLVRCRAHLHLVPYGLIASSADAMDGDIAWAVEVQFYFGGAGLSCGATKATGDHHPFCSRLHAK